MTEDNIGKIELPTKYDPHTSRQHWYQLWEENGYFAAPARSTNPYSIVIPPPNVTGKLHIGHALNNTLQDILCRWKRMSGFDVLWMPGTDHAGIATQSVVEREIKKAEGKNRHDLGREELVRRIWQWKEEYGNTITRQLRYLGSSCDWERERFTMDDGLSKAVREVFVRLYHEGYIYQGDYMVNWDPVLLTAISDDEVEYVDRNGSLWFVKYPLADGSGYFEIATTRPETILGDTAVAVNPDDDRWKPMIGKEVTVPCTGRKVPVIADSAIDPEFGTGGLKVTPAHDLTDWEIGRRHNLPVIDIFDVHARINEHGGVYQGLDRYACRKKIVEDLEAKGLLIKTEPYKNRVGVCYRSGADIEPRLSKQWFIRMEPLMVEARQVVEDGRVRFVPDQWKNTYFAWLDNLRDWCISRQIWWGHRVPVWYCASCGKMTVTMEDPEQCCHCQSPNIKQDPDVLDTWFSSALWPFSTMGWPQDTELLKTYYPTSVLVTGHDIIFFWVARMIMMGMHFMKQVPFHEVYITALVRDEQGRKMSKSLGNAIDPVEVIDEYGVDAVRFTLAIMAAQGRNINLGAKRIEGYRNFINKIWNASRLVLGSCGDAGAGWAGKTPTPLAQRPWEDRWIVSRLQETIVATVEGLESYRFNDASGVLYDFLWKEYCDWYLELIKPRLWDSTHPSFLAALTTALDVLEQILRLLHPFCPFVTEDIWHRVSEARQALGICEHTDIAASVMLTAYPPPDSSLIDEALETDVRRFQELTYAIRNLRAEVGIKPGDTVDVLITPASDHDLPFLERYWEPVVRLAKTCTELKIHQGEPPEQASIAVADGNLKVMIQWSAEMREKEVSRLRKRIEQLVSHQTRLRKKLDNPEFTGKAPAAVIEKERGNLEQTTHELETLQTQLERISDTR